MGLQESAGLDCKRLCVQCYGCWTYLLGHREALKNLSAFKKKKTSEIKQRLALDGGEAFQWFRGPTAKS